MAHRSFRFEQLVPLDRLSQTRCTILGVGAIGHQLAQVLAGMGVTKLSLWDPDKVNVENLGPQLYSEDHIGREKVEACADDCNFLSKEAQSCVFPKPFEADNDDDWQETFDSVLFMCVDSMDTRGEIFEKLVERYSPYIPVFFDARMAAEALQVYCLDPMMPDHAEMYRKTLFPSSEAEELPCTAKATTYCAMMAAAWLAQQYVKFLRFEAAGRQKYIPPAFMTEVAMVTGEMTTVDWPPSPEPEDEETKSPAESGSTVPELGDEPIPLAGGEQDEVDVPDKDLAPMMEESST